MQAFLSTLAYARKRLRALAAATKRRPRRAEMTGACSWTFCPLTQAIKTTMHACTHILAVQFAHRSMSFTALNGELEVVCAQS